GHTRLVSDWSSDVCSSDLAKMIMLITLAELGDSIKAISEAAERAFAPAAVLRSAPGENLYLVGGASRAIARLHMEHTHYPLHIEIGRASCRERGGVWGGGG